MHQLRNPPARAWYVPRSLHFATSSKRLSQAICSRLLQRLRGPLHEPYENRMAILKAQVGRVRWGAVKRSANQYLNHGNTLNNRLFIRPVQCTNRETHRHAHGTFRGPSTLRRFRNDYRKRFVRGCFNDYRDRCTNPTKTDWQNSLPKAGCFP